MKELLVLVPAALLIALVELDSNCFGQFMVSRPIVLGPLLGFVLGDIPSDVWMGVALEMLTLDTLPVGGHLALNPAVAIGAALLFVSEPYSVMSEAAFPAGLCIGSLHRRLEAPLRQFRCRYSHEADEQVRRGRAPALGRMVLSSMVLQAAMTLVILLVAVIALKPFFTDILRVLPPFLLEGLDLGMLVVPWLGIAVLIRTSPWLPGRGAR